MIWNVCNGLDYYNCSSYGFFVIIFAVNFLIWLWIDERWKVKVMFEDVPAADGKHLHTLRRSRRRLIEMLNSGLSWPCRNPVLTPHVWAPFAPLTCSSRDDLHWCGPDSRSQTSTLWIQYKHTLTITAVLNVTMVTYFVIVRHLLIITWGLKTTSRLGLYVGSKITFLLGFFHPSETAALCV